MQALLVAVPPALPGHGADHQVHPVGGGHPPGVFAQGEGSHLRRRLLPPGDGHDAAEHQLQVPQQNGFPGAGIGAAGGLHRRRKHGLPVLLSDLPAAPGLQLVHEIGQQDGPAQVQGHQLRPVQQQKKRVGGVLRPGRDHVDAHHAGAPRVDGDVAHIVQAAAAIPPFQPGHFCHIASPFMGNGFGGVLGTIPFLRGRAHGPCPKRHSIVKHSVGRGPCLPTIVPADSRPLSRPTAGALPRNRLASSATGGASAISPPFCAPGRRASDCIKCGKCEKACPQHLPIRQLLEQVSQEFDKAR